VVRSRRRGLRAARLQQRRGASLSGSALGGTRPSRRYRHIGDRNGSPLVT
jgi:hypothetical protein